MARFFCIAIILLVGRPTFAQITSTFNSDADGWTFFNGSTGASLPGTFNAAGGNPDGYINLTYTSSTSITVQSWVAPSKFLGSQLVRSYGMNFSFSLQQSTAGTNSNGNGDVRIESGSTALIFSLVTKPAVAPAWTTYTLRLDETQPWRISSTTGPIATRSQIMQVLANITAIEIRGTYATAASYISGLDNVVLEQRTLTPAPTITSISPAFGNSGEVITINGSGFGSTVADNAVYFGGVSAPITSAAINQLTVTVPQGARYDGITVINKSNGLSATSSEKFVPTFTGGGRIITSSFKSKVDFLLDATLGNDVNGIRASDLDGDGWNDIIVSEQTPASVSIFRNLGAGGVISTSSFSSKIVLNGGGSSSGLFIVDLDGDGKQDIIAANNSSFATFRNTSTSGNVVFETAETWPMANSGFLSNVIDVDGDGRPELIGQHGNGSVAVDFWIAQNISSSGNIEFGPSVSYFGGSILDAGGVVSFGDLDNDGKPELLVSHNFGDRFSILQNSSMPGSIALNNLGTIVTSQYNRGLSIVDLNFDGKNDITWKRSGNSSVYIRLNNNSGSALAPADFNTEIVLTGDLSTYGGMSIGDINGDGKPDIAASDNADVGVFENSYSGGVFDANAFIPAYQLQGNGNSTYPTSPIVADLNGDSKPELLIGITNSSPVRISIYENKNAHAPVISVNTVSPLAAPVGATVTITGNHFSSVPNENHVYFGAVEATVLSSTTTTLAVSVPAGAAYAPVSVRVGELTSRYRLPFVTIFSPGVTFNNTHFASPINFTLTAANYDIEIGDLNHDGKPDILAEANGGYAFRNTHTAGAITTSSLVADDTLSPGSFINPRIEDFDGDGLLDAAAVSGAAHRNISTSTELSFQPSITLALGASTMDMADFNNDGKTDFAVTADLSGTGDLIIQENRSTAGIFTAGTYGSFSSNIIFNKPAAGGGIVSEDFDGDGFADVATTNPLTDNISIYRNIGLLKVSTSQFASRIDLAAGDSPGRIYKGDFDADGKTDLVLYHAGTNATLLTVFHNTSTLGNISFTRFDLTNPSSTTVASVADLDGDGKPEIITTSETGNRFSIFKNIHTSGALTAASFAVPFNTTVTAPRGLATGDLNLDGRPEIIITRAAGLLLVYENLIPKVTLNITQQPVNPNNRCEGLDFTFSTDAAGATNITYQWQKYNSVSLRFENISNGSGYSGVTTKNLLITNVQAAQAGDYRCLVMGDYASPTFCNTGTLTVNPTPAPPTVTGASRCGEGSVTLTASGTADGNFIWYGSNGMSEPIAGENNSTYTTPSLTSTTDYFVSIVNAFCESALVQVTATLTIPAGPTVSNASLCGSGSVTLTASGGSNGQYRWYTTASGGTSITGETNSTYTTGTITSSTTYYVSIDNGSCESSRTAVTASIITAPTAPTVTGGVACGPSASVTLTASGGTNGEYRWYTAATGGTAIMGEVNSTYTTPSITATTTYYVAINNGTCESTRTSVIATINALPAKPTITLSGSAGICSGQSVTLSAPAGFTYQWSNGATTQQITVNTAGSFTVQVNNGTCLSVSSDPAVITIITCNQPPVISTTTATTVVEGSVTINLSALLSDPDNNLDLSTLKIVVPPTSGAIATIIGQNLVINYAGINFGGTDKLTIEICDVAGVCVQQELSIEVGGDIIAYNGVSNNGDDKNAIFLLKYIDSLPDTKENKVTIYNRWGDVVWEGVNYDNTNVVFTGQNKNGNDLPTGTYFYKIEFTSGKSSVTGYLSLKR